MQGPLAVFYGRRELNNTLLPLIITCLNAQEWQLRCALGCDSRPHLDHGWVGLFA